MKFNLACVLTLVVLSTNGALSAPHSKHSKHSRADDFCDGQPPTGGRQIKSGSCSTTVQGQIPSVNHMISTIITNPPDHELLLSDTPFQVEVLVNNLDTGHFSDPDNEYYLFPQELNDNGLIKGHLHVTIQNIDTNTPPNPQKFVFFKGVEDKAKKGRLSVDVVQKNGTPGLAPGRYRICTLTSSFSHQPLIMPVAKRGSQDDCIRITVNIPIDKKGEVGKQKDVKDDKKEEVGKQKDVKDDKKEEVGKQKDVKDDKKEDVEKQKDVKDDKKEDVEKQNDKPAGKE